MAGYTEALARRGLQPDVREARRLHLAADLTDRLAEIRERLRRDGLTVATAEGDGVKGHPLLGAERDTTAAIARLLDGVSLDAVPVKDAAKQRAAQAAWRSRRRGDA